MKLSGFVLDTDEARGNCLRWAQQGKLRRVTIQANAWPHAVKNLAAFAGFKSVLNPLGCEVGLTTWGTGDPVADAVEIGRLRGQVPMPPDFWTLNLEDVPDPAKTYVGKNVALLMQATKPEPVHISYNGLAEQMGFDFRRYSQRGCEVAGQCYGPNGEQPWEGWPSPAESVSSALRPRICWGGSPKSPAWWYRIKVGTTYKWAYVVGWNPTNGKLEMRTPAGTVFWADGGPVGDHLEFFDPRLLRNTNTTWVGSVDGFATYPKIGYALSTTRPATPEQLADLARQARYGTRPICKNVWLYTLDNATDKQVDALVAVA